MRREKEKGKRKYTKKEKRFGKKLSICRKEKSTVMNEQNSRRMLYNAYKMSFGLKDCNNKMETMRTAIF
jgi:hypothetical protein